MKVFTKDEATTVERPERGPWKWPEPVNVMISNCGPVLDPVLGSAFGHRVNGDPVEFAIAVNMLQTLYRCGYAVVKLDDETVEAGNLTKAELLGALKVEREHTRYEREQRLDDLLRIGEASESIVKAERERLGAELEKAVASFRSANEAYNQMAAKYDALREFARRLWYGARQRARLAEHRALVLEAHRLGVIALPAGVADALKDAKPQEARP